jgi:hypothetical protein
VPFVPFIVVFGNAVAQANKDDLALLGKVVTTLQSAALISPAVEKLKTACSKFHQIASAYLAQLPPRTEIQPTAWQPNAGMPIGQSIAEYGQPDMEFIPDLPLTQQDWDDMLDWDLGIGAENARAMSTFFEQYMTGNTNTYQ